jgi:hypothetical protein
LHEPIRTEAVDLSVSAAVDDEVCEYGAKHRNELEAMAGESAGVIATARVVQAAEISQLPAPDFRSERVTKICPLSAVLGLRLI